MKNIEIWIYSEKVKDSEELNVYHSIIDAISYWIGECEKIIEDKAIAEKYISIKINMIGNSMEYFYDQEYKGDCLKILLQ